MSFGQPRGYGKTPPVAGILGGLIQGLLGYQQAREQRKQDKLRELFQAAQLRHQTAQDQGDVADRAFRQRQYADEQARTGRLDEQNLASNFPEHHGAVPSLPAMVPGAPGGIGLGGVMPAQPASLGRPHWMIQQANQEKAAAANDFRDQAGRLEVIRQQGELRQQMENVRNQGKILAATAKSKEDYLTRMADAFHKTLIPLGAQQSDYPAYIREHEDIWDHMHGAGGGAMPGSLQQPPPQQAPPEGPYNPTFPTSGRIPGGLDALRGLLQSRGMPTTPGIAPGPMPPLQGRPSSGMLPGVVAGLAEKRARTEAATSNAAAATKNATTNAGRLRETQRNNDLTNADRDSLRAQQNRLARMRDTTTRRGQDLSSNTAKARLRETVRHNGVTEKASVAEKNTGKSTPEERAWHQRLMTQRSIYEGARQAYYAETKIAGKGAGTARLNELGADLATKQAALEDTASNPPTLQRQATYQKGQGKTLSSDEQQLVGLLQKQHGYSYQKAFNRVIAKRSGP